ncbi:MULTISPECIES: MFS transporter [Protofrankia]|uniref:Drug resistance transporter, EmrB/QacA subfamily n=1 Tax=Candidatus Protofrankia datiscae TaxID=2716812 RepID=F8B0H3_9ACTN|nr:MULTISPECIES: MFS transporter [Protofrankia]AEH09722.1 drug resistance transporter, EmrB/QacA subfamily [Candidatus Protofrankia datiscae]
MTGLADPTADPTTGPAGSAAAAAGHPRRWSILAVLVLSVLLTVLDGTIINVALRVLADPEQGLGATQSQLEWAINSFTLVFAALLFTWGILGDRIGHRRTLVTGILIFGASSVGAAYADTPAQLILWRVVMGIGAAALPPATLSIIMHVFPPSQRPQAIGIWAGSSGLAAVLGPIVGGILLGHFWWGSIFLINIPVVLVALAGTVALVPESRDPAPGRLDPLGVALSIAGIMLLVFGIVEGGRLADWTQARVLGPLLGGLALLAAFVRYELVIGHPALDVRLFRDRRMSAAAVAVGLAFFAIFGLTFFMVFYLQSIRGYSPLESGLALLPLAVGLGMFSARSPKLAERRGYRLVVSAGLLLASLCFFGYAFLDTDSPAWVIFLIFFLQGIGMAHVMPPATEAVMGLLPASRAGVASSITNVTRNLGGALGIAVLGSLLAVRYRDELEPHLAAVPPPARTDATESVEAARAIAASLGPSGRTLWADASDAFVSAMHSTAIGCALAGLLGVIVVAVGMPGARESATMHHRIPQPAAPGPQPAASRPVGPRPSKS